MWGQIILMGALAAAQQATPWSVDEVTLPSGEQAIVLGRDGPRGRAEVRALSEQRREIGVFSDDCASASEMFASSDPALRRADARDGVAAYIGPEECRLDGDVLDGFDAGYDAFEAKLKASPLPPAQAWMGGINGYEASRETDTLWVKYEVADMMRRRVGHGTIIAPSKACRDSMETFAADAGPASDTAGRIEAARVAVAGAVDAAVAKCGMPAGTAARVMAGFTEAVAREEAKLAKDAAERR